MFDRVKATHLNYIKLAFHIALIINDKSFWYTDSVIVRLIKVPLERCCLQTFALTITGLIILDNSEKYLALDIIGHSKGLDISHQKTVKASLYLLPAVLLLPSTPCTCAHQHNTVWRTTSRLQTRKPSVFRFCHHISKPCRHKNLLLWIDEIGIQRSIYVLFIYFFYFSHLLLYKIQRRQNLGWAHEDP